MSTMSISALELLEASQMPAAHARAIAKAMEVDFVHRQDVLATKLDLEKSFSATAEKTQELFRAFAEKIDRNFDAIKVQRDEDMKDINRRFDDSRNWTIGMAIVILGAISSAFFWMVDRQDALFCSIAFHRDKT